MEKVFGFLVIIVLLYKMIQLICDIHYGLTKEKHIDSFRMELFQKTKKLYTKQEIRDAIEKTIRKSFIELIIVLLMLIVLLIILL